MIFRLANREAEANFPLIPQEFELYKKYWKESGITDYAIKINDVTELMSLEALARSTDSTVHGIFLSGSTISIIRQGDNINDYQ